MKKGKYRVVFVCSHPVQYMAQVFRGMALVRSNCQDFVFSYIVLHHLPTKELALNYIEDMLWVLKPGGLFLFHFVIPPSRGTESVDPRTPLVRTGFSRRFRSKYGHLSRVPLVNSRTAEAVP